MTGIVLMLVLAVTVEGIVQYIKSIVEMVTKKDYKTAVTQLSAARTREVGRYHLLQGLNPVFLLSGEGQP